MTRARKLLILAGTALLFVVSWQLYRRSEAAMLRAASRVSSPAGIESLAGKYDIEPYPQNEFFKNTREAAYSSQPGSYYRHQHYFRWDFDESGRRLGYLRTTHREVWRFEFSSSERSGELAK